MALPDSISERAREGAKVRREVLGAAYVDAGKQRANPFTQHFIEFTQTQCWGNVWLREGLSHKTRSMLNVCMLAALARWHEFAARSITASPPKRLRRFCCTPPSMPASRSPPKASAAPMR